MGVVCPLSPTTVPPRLHQTPLTPTLNHPASLITPFTGNHWPQIDALGRQPSLQHRLFLLQSHNTGVAWREGRLLDEGRHNLSGKIEDGGAFKTPTLREVAKTAPYMHDGSLATLEDVIEFYSEGGRKNPYLAPLIRPGRFTSQERLALLAFLRALSGRVVEG